MTACAKKKGKAPCAKGSHPWRIHGPGVFQYKPKPLPAPSSMNPKLQFKEAS